MITVEKLKIYQAFNGDIDGWARAGTSAQKSSITSNDWRAIEAFLQDLALVKKGLAAETFLLSIEERLKEDGNDAITIQEIKRMAGLN